MVWDRAHITIAIKEKLMYLLSIGDIANTLHYDLYLNFKGHKIDNADI